MRAASAEILIVASMCEPDGRPVLTLEQAARLKPAIASRPLDAVLDINGGANEKRLKARTEDWFCTSWRSRSVVARSPSGRHVRARPSSSRSVPHRSWPFDDLHRYHRPAALIAGSLGGGDLVRLEWLQPPPAYDENGHTSADRDLYAAAGLKPRG